MLLTTSPVDAVLHTIATDYGNLDILVDSASRLPRFNQVSRKGFHNRANTNAIGVLSVTDLFLDLLRKSYGRRIILVSSSVGSIADTKCDVQTVKRKWL